MPILSKDHLALIAAFAPVFSGRVWRHVQVLLVGAILAPEKRTVTALLRVMGLSEERNSQTYHRVLNRAAWSSLEMSHTVSCGTREIFIRRYATQTWQRQYARC